MTVNKNTEYSILQDLLNTYIDIYHCRYSTLSRHLLHVFARVYLRTEQECIILQSNRSWQWQWQCVCATEPHIRLRVRNSSYCPPSPAHIFCFLLLHVSKLIRLSLFCIQCYATVYYTFIHSRVTVWCFIFQNLHLTTYFRHLVNR